VFPAIMMLRHIPWRPPFDGTCIPRDLLREIAVMIIKVEAVAK
jgi:hypothetical protein